jgi:phosphate-selective porin OprO/OprP
MYKYRLKLNVFLLIVISVNAVADNVASTSHDIDIFNESGLALNSKDFYFRINGRLMVDFSTWQGAAFSGVADAKGSGSEVRRSRIYLKGKYHDWQYRFQTNFNESGASNSNTYIKYAGFDNFDVFIGKHAEPFGLESSNSSKYIPALERTVTGNSHFAGDRELGVSIAGHKNNYAYQIGLYDIDSTPTDNNYAITGRFNFLAVNFKDNLLHLGLGFSSRQLDASTPFKAQDRAGVHSTEIKSITTDAFFANSSTVYNFEISYDYARFNVTGEYLLSDISELGSSINREFSSYYLQSSYFLTTDQRPYDIASGTFLGVTPNTPNGAWEIFFRMEKVDFQDKDYGSEAQILTLGINYFATKHTRLSLNYINSEIDYGLLTNNGNSIDGSAMTFRAQFYW